MRRSVAVTFVGAVLVASGVLVAQQGNAPAAAAAGPPASMNWAYATPPAPAGGAAAGRAGGPAAAPAPDPTPRQLPGSTLSFTTAQIRDGFGPADWFPQDHPVMPEIVARGKRPDVRACALCHMPNGKGRPENAGVAGLPVDYFIQTMNDFRADLRKSAEPRKGNTNVMITIAKGMTPEEIRIAAEYFGSMKWSPWITVRETSMVPVTRSQGGMWIPVEPHAEEPIGMRIIETPENVERTEQFRDPRSGFIAYVPAGSIAKGQALATTGGNGKTVACATCHGADLLGMGPVPGIAGRSPSYMARQMYDMKTGARRGTWSALMKPVVDKLTDEDFVSLAAYVASRPAAAGAATR
jgi:cytochrome c553